MLFRKEILIAGVMTAAVAAVGGCSSHHGYDEGGTEVVPAGYAADDTYYDQGTYEGDYWVWHDRDGHDHREARTDHERRANAQYDRRSSDSGRRDMGNVGNDRRDTGNANRGQEQQASHDRQIQQSRQTEQSRQTNQARPQNQSHGPAANEHAQEGHPAQAGGRNADENGGDRR
jgi:hypothetical protein